MRGFLSILGLGLFIAAAIFVGLQVKRLDKESEVIATSNSLVWDQLGVAVPPEFRESSVVRDEANGLWIVNGKLMRSSNGQRMAEEPYQATLEQICRDGSDRSCWRLASLVVSGREMDLAQKKGDGLSMIPLEEKVVLPPEGEELPGMAQPQAAAPEAQAEAMGEGTGASGPKAVEQTVSSILETSGDEGAVQEAVVSPPPDGKELIRRIQVALGDLGLNPGPADGVFGPRTREAISSFQERSGLPVNGEPSVELLRAMEAEL